MVPRYPLIRLAGGHPLTDQEKAFSHLLTNEEIAQVITYLAATGLPVGLLINFGRKRLEFKRILPPKKLEGWQNRIQRYLWKPPIR